jgi:hypothetical protein
MQYRRILGLLLIPLLAAPVAAAAALHLHVPKPLNIEADLSEEGLDLYFLVDAYLFRHWTGIDARSLVDLEATEYEQRCEELSEFLMIHAPVAIDGIDVRPVIEDIEFQEGFAENDFVDFVGVSGRYGVKARPGTIEFNWTRFDTEDAFPLESAYLIFSSEDDFQILRFRADDPTRVWRRPGAPPVVDPDLVAPGVAPPQGRLPIVSVGILGVLLAMALGMRGRRVAVPRIVTFVTLGLVGAYLAGSVTVVEFRWPGESAIALPSEDEADALFATLHRNIYRAFDYSDEGQIYDALARSLAPELIDTVYGEVYRSLRMQLEQDEVAACKIKSVRILDSNPDLPEDPETPAFDVVARWEVIGTVRHWGHGHWRTNRYSARYRVRWEEEDGWRIGAVEILGQERVDDGRESAL